MKSTLLASSNETIKARGKIVLGKRLSLHSGPEKTVPSTVREYIRRPSGLVNPGDYEKWGLNEESEFVKRVNYTLVSTQDFSTHR